MIVRDFDVGRTIVGPREARAVLDIDPNRMLSLGVLRQWMQFVVRRYSEIVQLCCRVDHPQFSPGDLQEVRRKAFGAIAVEDFAGNCVLEAPDIPLGR